MQTAEVVPDNGDGHAALVFALVGPGAHQDPSLDVMLDPANAAPAPRSKGSRGGNGGRGGCSKSALAAQSKQQILDKITGARDEANDKGRVIQQNLAIAVQNNSQSSENMNALEAHRQKVDDLDKQKKTLKGELLDKDWIELTAELGDRDGWTPAMQICSTKTSTGTQGVRQSST